MNKHLALAVAFTAASLSAQTGWAGKTDMKVSVATKNGLAVRATSDFNKGITKSAGIPDGTDITRARYIRVDARNGYASAWAGGTYNRKIGSGAMLNDNGYGWSIYGRNQGTACTANGDSKKASCGAHSILVNFKVKSGEEVTLVVHYGGSATDKLAAASGSVDIGNDGKAEVTAKYGAKRSFTAKEFKIKGGKDGVTVRLTTNGNAKNDKKTRGTYSTWAAVYVKKAPKTIKCTITAYDQKNDPDKNPNKGCGGDLSATSGTSFGSRWVRLSLKNAAKNAAGFFVIGDKATELPLPLTTCKLLVNVQGFFAFKTNDKGEATHFFRASSALKGAVYGQDVILEFSNKNTGLKVTSSNGIKVECKEQ